MEVFSVFSSEKKIIKMLIDSLLNNKRIKQVNKDDDTIYFQIISNNSLYLYVHYQTSFEEEVKFNFDPEEEQFIKLFFSNSEIFMLDISYEDFTLLLQLLSDFVFSIKPQFSEKTIPVLFHDPFGNFYEIKQGSISKMDNRQVGR